ncbi:response regulator [Altererythrobacter xixiisoli]|uniref:histidine kinase n=1 Tax=Croceibacterium xixiisoli TaxID=1476466 RepID=A0A6I4TWW3_9SPHN|nr:response regulator [Croceibacterium xixiisoli]MXP00656.1 response regulator [Croceibacterium xixiisoli]
MSIELDKLRTHFGGFLLPLLWAHVPLLAAIAWAMGRSAPGAAIAGAVLAGAYHLSWRQYGPSAPTRYLSAVALVMEPAILLYLFQGHAWQMDMHMYFFAMLALTIGWFDKRAVLVAATATALHHLLLLFLLPFAVFPGEGNLARVVLHAAIVAFQTAVLVWVSDMVVASFARISRMSAEIREQNAILEERTREAEDASRAKSMFLANMSHEIRTPMNAILGFCHLFQRVELDGKQRDYITKINGAAVALLRLINDILDFSKNEAGKLELEIHSFDLRHSIGNQIHLVETAAAAKGVIIEGRFADTLPPRLLGDELRFNQVVLNLLSNAVKFTDQGSVTVSARMLTCTDDEATIEVSVRDSGIGMSAEQQASLFSSFSQADSSTTRKFGGTGLGLAISRQIVEQMGGTIRVESEIGVGSTFLFKLTLPIDRQSALLDLAPAPVVQGLRILAADDNPAARQIIEEMFAGWEIPVDLVASGQEAVGALETAARFGKPYDLLLLDWKMPGLDGMDTLKAMRNSQRITDLPVTIMITAYGADEFMASVGKSDVAAFLSKPIEPRALLDTISDLFSKVEPSAPQIIADANHPPMVAEHLRGQKVLLVEDNDINREIATELLSDAGLLTDIAENGRIACDRVAAHGTEYAAILMDVQMPEMDGITATGVIRREWSAEKLPIIAMTAHAYEEERQRCFAAGMNDHVSKPVDPAALVRTLDRWLKPVAAATADAPAKVEAAPPVARDLPDELPPFGLSAALARVNGKAALLRKLIVSFGQSYGDAGRDLNALLANGQVEEARRFAHTLKGVAGSLELPGVQAIAADIERQIASGALSDVSTRIAALDAELAPAITAARSLTAATAQAREDTGITVASDAEIAAAAEALRDLLRRRSLKARSGFATLATALGLPPEKQDSHPVRQALDQLDYEKALELLDEISTPSPEGIDRARSDA